MRNRDGFPGRTVGLKYVAITGVMSATLALALVPV